MRSTKGKNKKMLAVLIFSLIIVFLVTAGTIAWLTRMSSLTNSFTIGTIETPIKSPLEPHEEISIDGNIYEPSWNPPEGGHKLIPSATYAKDPYVGIGPGSEDAVAYVYVENNFSDKVYFTINTGWEAVLAEDGSEDGTYTSGLFKYTSTLEGSATNDTWTTTPLFSNVVTDPTSNTEDFTVAEGKDSTIVVSCFLHQAKNGNEDIPTSTIEAAAKEAFKIQQQN